MLRLIPALALTLAIAGCGGGGDKPKRTATVQPGKVVNVIAGEYFYDPGALVVTGGGKFAFEMKNEGSLAHDLKVRRGDEEIGGIKPFQGKGRSEGTTLALSPGEYEFYCSVGDHEALGMKGTLRVE
ncbi:MAG: cupredoxin domain-containing protein [Thermoleophilaceae bacterium]|nr:cupredoxin domain-containing protein [Thermoleophilaceae bacterium]